MAAAQGRAKALKAVDAIFDRYHLIAASKNFTGFDKHVMENLVMTDASLEGTVDFDLLIDERYTNLNNVMHGGAAGVIFDMCTTSALGPLAKPGFWDFMGGVTRTLNISYLRAVPVGTTIHIHSKVTQAGRTMAMIRGVMTSQDGKTIYCTCEHHKVGVPTQAEHLKYRVSWDDLWEDADGGKSIDGKAQGKSKL